MTLPSTIFVLCTGRCGSMTLARACAHLSSHTSAHEGRTHALGDDRFAYPANHIEIDNRLTWLLGRLERHWGDNAAYVHLTRDPEATAQSFAQRAHQGIIKGYREAILARSHNLSRKASVLDFCKDYVDTANANIIHYLSDKTYKISMQLETLAPDFDHFLSWIGATGDLDAARVEISVIHNATTKET